MKLRELLCIAVLTLSAAVPIAHAANTWYVNGNTGRYSNNCLSATNACKTIGQAISRASAGDTIKVAAATYQENLTISINLGMIGAAPSTTVIDGGGRGTVITVNGGANVQLSRLTIRNGSGLYSGGGIQNKGALVINESSVTGNTSSHSGGGIGNDASMTINSSTVSNNGGGGFLAFGGGGIQNQGTLIINNSTISGNTSYLGAGPGIENWDGTLTISNSTISAGSSAVSVINGHVSVQNNVFAYNSGNCYELHSSSFSSEGYNLSSDGTCNFSGPGDLNNIDPLLGPLQNNGGPTQTQALDPGSPAIDAGNPNGCTDGKGHLLKTDQRGAPRPDKEDTSGCDMGAYESQSD